MAPPPRVQVGDIGHEAFQVRRWGIVAHHKELTEGDVGEDVVCLILPTDLLRLLPKVRELLC